MNMNSCHLPQNPIFIVGYPRSGTTLLQALLASHPGVYTFPETHYFSTLEKQLSLDDYGGIQPMNINTALFFVSKKFPFMINLKERAEFYRLAETGNLTSKQLFEWIVGRFLRCIYGKAPKPPFLWIEKTPVHYNYLHKIINFYPAGKILAILRHPVPAVASRKSKFPFNKETDLSVLASSWKRMISVLELFKQSCPESIRLLRYEDLVLSPYIELRRHESFLSIPIKKKHLKNYYHHMSSLILPFETWKQDQKYKSVASTNPDHKQQISCRQAEYIESIVYTAMQKCGYSPFFSRRYHHDSL
jgi:hypothetical protein